MTYEKAIITIRQYIDWQDSDGITTHAKMPKRQDLREALLLSIETMKQLATEELPSSPAQLRFDSLQSLIERFVIDNR